jgi:hypothetical protein
MRERPVGKDFSPTHQACRQYAIGRLRSTPLRAALPHCTIRVQRQIWSGPVVHQNLGRSRSATPQFRHENPGETEASATRICAVAVRQCIALTRVHPVLNCSDSSPISVKSAHTSTRDGTTTGCHHARTFQSGSPASPSQPSIEKTRRIEAGPTDVSNATSWSRLPLQ